MPKRKAPMSVAEVNRLGEGNHRVGGVAGLTLQVNKGQGRCWSMRYTDQAGKRREVGIGSAHDIPLALARDKALQLRQQLKLDGVDPIKAKEDARLKAIEDAQRGVTFAQAIPAFLKSHAAKWSNEKHADQWSTTLDRYAGLLLPMAVADIAPSHVAEALTPAWSTKHETASRVRQRIEAVIAHADTHAKRLRPNPARWKHNLDNLLPTITREVAHHASMPWQALPAFMAKLKKMQGMGARALEFAVLCAARSGEVRGATWAEIEGDVWVIPAARMKGGKEHRVPLPATAVALLADLPRINDLVFPGTNDKPLSDMTLSAVLKRMKVEATVHGFRASFKSWGGDNAKDRELVEVSLAHAIGNQVEQAYNRTNLLERRRALMAEWSAFVTGDC